MDKQEKAISSEPDWPLTCNRFVAYIDIMGFKDMVARTPHNEIYEMMRKIEASKSINVYLYPGYKDPLLVKTTTYSDSIMIYSKDESDDALKSLLYTVSGFAYDLLVECIPYKGSVAFGRMTLDDKNSIYFGQPLIDAYLLQEELHFYGIIIHATAEKKIGNEKNYNKCLLDYSCPLKNGFSNHLTICPIYIHPPIDDEFKEHAEKPYKTIKDFRLNTSGYLRKYIDNTEQYLEYIKNLK